MKPSHVVFDSISSGWALHKDSVLLCWHHECLLELRKLAGINKWQTQYISNGLSIHECLKLELCCGTICIQTGLHFLSMQRAYFIEHT